MSALTVSNRVQLLFYCSYHLQLQSRWLGFCFTPVLRAAERNGFLVGRCVNLNRAQEDTWTLDLITCSSLLSYSNPHCGDEVGPGWAVITGTWTWQASCWGLLLCCVFRWYDSNVIQIEMVTVSMTELTRLEIYVWT